MSPEDEDEFGNQRPRGKRVRNSRAKRKMHDRNSKTRDDDYADQQAKLNEKLRQQAQSDYEQRQQALAKQLEDQRKRQQADADAAAKRAEDIRNQQNRGR